eukprot:scaffold322351_cov25-Prasinocladus_malaysianus.AAC.1
MLQTKEGKIWAHSAIGPKVVSYFKGQVSDEVHSSVVDGGYASNMKAQAARWVLIDRSEDRRGFGWLACLGLLSAGSRSSWTPCW